MYMFLVSRRPISLLRVKAFTPKECVKTEVNFVESENFANTQQLGNCCEIRCKLILLFYF